MLLWAAVAAYIAFVGILVYVFVIADPDESQLARFWTETVPTQAARLVKRTVGPKGFSVVKFWADRILIVIYCAVVFGGWTVIFFVVYPWGDAQGYRYVGWHHKIICYGVFVACVASWWKACTSSPGFITAETFERYDHYPYDHLLFVPGQICRTTGLRRIARSKFDRFKYKCNIPRFDHFCGWVNNTIGEENYRYFLAFLFVHVAMCVYGTVILAMLFYGELMEKQLIGATFFDRYTGEEIPATYWILAQYLFHRKTLEASIFLLMAVMSIALGMFLLYHVWLTSRNVTTNEAYRWDQFRKWYRRSVARYNVAVQNGEISPEQQRIDNATTTDNNSKSATAARQRPRPELPEGDVTCTPVPGKPPAEPETTAFSNHNKTSNNKSQQHQPHVLVEGENQDEDMIQHPGPEPSNIYDRGFIENWKEVLFPISLRTNPPEFKPKEV